MKIKLNFIYNLSIISLIVLLIVGHQLNKKNSSSKKNEIFNLTQQNISKNNQISKIQKNLLSSEQNINNFMNPENINFQKILEDKELENFESLKMSQYRTDEILFSGNYNASGTAYIDFFNDDKELVLATVDGIFAFAKIENFENFIKIQSNIFDLITYDDFYTNYDYGIKDILISKNDLFVSLIGQKKKECHNIKILKSEMNKSNLNFEVFYETPECVNKNNDHGYLAAQGGGGRMFTNNNSIFLTTGEFRNRPLAQDSEKAYGKILNIDLNLKNMNIISLGHRNPQGLYYSVKHDFIISTEHGPKGGDEININHKPLSKIKNYGWPISSYGEHYYKNYPTKILNQAPLNKSHKKFGFIEPIKYFVPSIGISQIVPLNEKDTEFLVGAMGNEVAEQDLGLHYIILNDDRKKVINHKYIPLNERVRDMIVSKDRKMIILFLETTSSLAILKKQTVN
jgi:hypothetical protein